MLRIHLFGPPRFEQDGVPIQIGRRKGVALLSYLVQMNQPVSRETLAALFWPEHGQREALKSLRRELARLKKSLGGDSILTNSRHLAFNVGAIVDTIRFQQQLQLLREHDHFPETGCSACLEALNGATDLYSDDFMAGFNLLDCPDFDAWQDYQRENLRQELGHSLHQLTRWHVFQQREEEAIYHCRRWLALDPLNESFRRILMQAHAQAGRPAEALRVYEEGASLLQKELGIAPAEETRQLYQEIRAGKFPDLGEATVTSMGFRREAVPATNRKRHSKLPQQPTSFIGRLQELSMIQLRLQEPACRLLTLIGPGGIGKTRMAIEVGERILEEGNPLFSDGVLFVPLTAASTPAEMIAAILGAAGVPSYENAQSIDSLLDFLQDKKILLILDNMEHLLQGSDIIQTILAVAPGVRILVTSRAALRLQAEWFHPVGGMSFPPRGSLGKKDGTNGDEKNSPQAYDAVRLFEQCARNASPDFSLSEELEAVVRICRMVEGMPLALEMAAAWLKVMDTSAIADELKHNLDLLASRFHHMPDRHQSIPVVFNQTWAMLEPSEQEAFARMSVFRGGFSREAARQVAHADLFVLSSLIDKALLYSTTHGHYRLHELLRQFAFRKLKEMKRVNECRAAHCQYYMKLLAELGPDLKGARQAHAFHKIKDKLENIRLAWNQALEQGDLQALSAALETITLYFFLRGRNQEGVDFLQAAYHRLSPGEDERPEEVWGRILSRICLLKSHLPPDVNTGTEIQTALSIAHQYDDQKEIAFCNFVRGVLKTLAQEDVAAAVQAYEQALQAYRSLNESFDLVQVLIWLGFCHGNNAQLDLYYRYNREALDLARASGHRAGVANALGNLVAWAFCTGDYATAQQFAREVGTIGVELDLPNVITHSTTQLCLAHFLKGELERSGELALEAHALALEIRLPLSIAYALTFLGLHASLQGDYQVGKRLGEESLATPAPRFGMIMAHWAVALACCGLEEDEVAWRHVQAMVEMARQAGFFAMTTWSLPVMAALYSRSGQKERAVHLLALARSHSQSPTGWQDKWSLLTELPVCLKHDLGQETFAAAWEQGKTLDLEQVVTEALNWPGVNLPVHRQ